MLTESSQPFPQQLKTTEAGDRKYRRFGSRFQTSQILVFIWRRRDFRITFLDRRFSKLESQQRG